MSTHKIVQFRLLAPQQEKISILDTLHKLGVCHLSTRDEFDKESDLHADTVIGQSSVISDNLLYLQWLIDQLAQYNIQVEHKTYSDVTLDKLFSKSDNIKKSVFSPLRKIYSKIQEIQTEERTLRDKQEKLQAFAFKSIDFFESPITQSIVCKIPQNFSVKKLSQLKKIAHVIQEKDSLLIRCKKSDETNVISILERLQCELLSIPEVNTTVADELRSIPKQIQLYVMQRKKLTADFVSLIKKQKDIINQLFVDFSTYAQRYEVTTQFSRTNHTFYAQGYVALTDVPTLKKLKKSSHAHIEIDKPKQPPIKLKNNWYVKKFEFLTKMFGLPKYGFIDPTFMLALCVPLFFGFMFSDIGYGIMVFFTSITILIIAKKHQKVLQDAGFVLCISSLSTILFGWLFGSFFGNLIYVKPLWFDPFSQAMTLLIIALGIGIIHMNIGFLFSFIESLKKKDYRQIVFVFFATIILQLGVVMTFLSTQLGMLLIAFSVGLFLWYRSLMGIMDITGLVGSWFSYSRLLALALATGGIALGINIIAEQLQGFGIIGIILSILVLVAGHTFNFLLNILGSSIHSVRLHFIELFSQFYDASGKPFVAYTTKKVDDTL